jgi:hypothetical protein
MLCMKWAIRHEALSLPINEEIGTVRTQGLIPAKVVLAWPSAVKLLLDAYSDDSAHLFRRKSPSDSEGFRPGIPIESVPFFRTNRSVATRVLQLLFVFVIECGARSQVAVLFRMDSPLSVMVWALWISLSRMASARVGSPMVSCQCSMGTCAAMRVEARS